MSQEDNVIIIGGGASGIVMGCQLQRQLNWTNFEIYEKAHDFGGTWLHNTYPGCGCDIPSHFYSFSFAKNPNWSQVYSSQPEIKQYMLDVAKKYNLYDHVHFNTECLGSEWNKEQDRWTVHFKNLKTGQTFSKSSKFLVVAAGVLSIPSPCPVPGIENFKGQHWHSAQWNHNVSLENKDVVVIGNGCSATQFVPVILPKVKSLKQFIRSQHWILDRPNFYYSNTFKWILRNVPGANTLYRLQLAAYLDYTFVMFKTKAGQSMRALISQGAEKYMKSLAPEKYHNLLIPKFEVGAKRRVFDTDYLRCLSDPKILLTDDPLVQIKEKSVLTKSGKEYPADVIVYANGFQTTELMMPMTIKGKSGEDIRSRWRRQGGARAYMGVTVSDFPNMFIMVGPNTLTGHYSVIFASECNVNIAIKLMKPLIGTNSKGTVEVKEEAEKKDVAWVQNQLKDCIFGDSGTDGWYLDKETKHNGTIYPHYQTHYWLRTLRTNWSDFDVRGAKKSKGLRFDLIFLVIILLGVLLSWLAIATKRL